MTSENVRGAFAPQMSALSDGLAWFFALKEPVLSVCNDSCMMKPQIYGFDFPQIVSNFFFEIGCTYSASFPSIGAAVIASLLCYCL